MLRLLFGTPASPFPPRNNNNKSTSNVSLNDNDFYSEYQDELRELRDANDTKNNNSDPSLPTTPSSKKPAKDHRRLPTFNDNNDIRNKKIPSPPTPIVKFKRRRLIKKNREFQAGLNPNSKRCSRLNITEKSRKLHREALINNKFEQVTTNNNINDEDDQKSSILLDNFDSITPGGPNNNSSIDKNSTNNCEIQQNSMDKVINDSIDNDDYDSDDDVLDGIPTNNGFDSPNTNNIPPINNIIDGSSDEDDDEYSRIDSSYEDEDDDEFLLRIPKF